MLTISEKNALEHACTSKPIAAQSAWLGEVLRQIFLFPALRLFLSLAISGADELVGKGPYIFAANHSSHLDAPVFLAALPLRLRLQVRIAAAADYFFTRRWLAILVALILNAFPFERKQPACLASLAYTEHLLQRGQSLLIFPEGTRTRDGQIQRFKHGVGRIEHNSGANVVPVWINGTFTALPRGARWPRRQNITIKFGMPLRFSQEDEPAAISAAIEDAVRALAL